MKKRLFSLIMVLTLLVGVVGVLPARAADVTPPVDAVGSVLRQSSADDEPTAVPFASGAQVFRYLKEYILGHATLTQGADTLLMEQGTASDGTVLDLVLDYNADENVIVAMLQTEGLGMEGFWAFVGIEPNASVPLEAGLLYQDSPVVLMNLQSGFCSNHMDVDYVGYYGPADYRSDLNEYTYACCWMLVCYLQDVLAEGGYSVDDLGLVYAAHEFGIGEGPFKDVRYSSYYYDAVIWAVNNGITNGTSFVTFGPNQTCTRGQVVTFLWRSAGQPKASSTANPFTDVRPGAYYYDAVLWAVEQGITNGVSATKFGPNEACTRGQVVTFLYRASGSPAPESSANPFRDVKTTAYYYDAVLWAVEQGITNGTKADAFSPNATCTRAQIVTFLYRAQK